MPFDTPITIRETIRRIQHREFLLPGIQREFVWQPDQELRRRTLRWAKKLRVNAKMIRVQEMTRKWGSCSSRGTVTFAADLADQSGRFQDFVIVHELLHLRVPTHGQLFKALMSAYVPGWRELEAPRGAETDVMPRKHGAESQSSGAREPENGVPL